MRPVPRHAIVDWREPWGRTKTLGWTLLAVAIALGWIGLLLALADWRPL